MDDSIAYRRAGIATRDENHILFAQTMAFVAGTAGLFALGAYLGRDFGGAGPSSRTSPRSPPSSACSSRPAAAAS